MCRTSLSAFGSNSLPSRRKQPGHEYDDGTAGSLAGAGLLAVLGVGATAGTASVQSTPTGQVGTESRPVETVTLAGLDGPLTDGQRVTSLVVDGLEITDGTLSISGGT